MTVIKVKEAYENNLKRISLEIPKNKITAITGISGSGKSSLIYNVLAQEAKRREKIASGNASCLDYALRPKFEKIENLPYCVTLKQRGLSESIASTLATITKLHELLRAELTQYGEIIGDNGNIIKEPTTDDIKQFVQSYHPKASVEIFAIVCDQKHTNGKKELELLKLNRIKEAVFVSSYDDKQRWKKITALKDLNERYAHTILVSVNSLNELEKYQGLAQENFYLKLGSLDLKLHTDFLDSQTGKIYQKKSSQLLSFNAAEKRSGKCSKCNGRGIIEELDLDNLILKNKPLAENFLNLAKNEAGGYKYVMLYQDTIDQTLKKAKIDKQKKFFDLSPDEQKIIKNFIFLKIQQHQGQPSIGKFIKSIPCTECDGTRLNYKANAVKIHGFNISELLSKTVNELYLFFSDKKLHHKKILAILESLKKATLEYLTLDRTTDTLSGGELQRLKLSLELNSEYKGLLYILDEPSVGLHPFNNNQIIHLIKNLRDKENTIIISEHSPDYIKNSDYTIELGAGSGDAGGEVIFTGKTKKLQDTSHLRNKIEIDFNNALELISVNANNIKNENFIIPLNCLSAISGVSGSGKSSLIHKALIPNIKQYIADKSIDRSLIKEIKNIEKIAAVVELTQSQIGINSRSIVATYLNIFDRIRDIFASLEISKEFGFDKGYFSFNSIDGACETCKGLGELNNNLCPSCLGLRYKPEILDIKYNDLNIIEILASPLSELSKIFNDEKLKFAFEILHKLGLAHISLGRTTPTLSGGEAQRLKLAETLISAANKIKKGNFIFVLDEPTTGLSNKDATKLYSIFDEIIAFNNSIIIIEHNLEIIKNSDFIMELGLGSGDAGGKQIFAGKYEDLLKNQISLTAKAFNGEYESIKTNKLQQPNLKYKNYSTHSLPDCNRFYLDEKHFEIEKFFYENHCVKTDNEKHKYFKTKKELFAFVDSLAEYTVTFNPYVSDLFKYKIIPISIKKNKLKHLKKLGFNIDINDYAVDEWQFRVKVENIEKAYNFGNGWITVETKNSKYELFTRLVSINDKLIGTPKITEHSFNLYLNSCNDCNGNGIRAAYKKTLIIKDENKSILNEGFLKFPLKLQLKNVVTKFLKEGLFDFTKPFSQLDDEKKNIFLFGFQHYKFLKPKGKKTTLSDYIKWQGLYSLIYDNLDRIEIEPEIRDSKHNIICPFCLSGFKKEVSFYIANKKSIIDYL